MEHIIDNGVLRLVFDGDQQQFTSIENVQDKVSILHHLVVTPLCQVVCLEDGGQERLVYTPAGSWVVEASPHKISLRTDSIHNQAAGIKPITLHVTVELIAGSCESEWRLRLENNTADLDVVEVLFPFVRGIALGKDWRDDAIVYPHHAGEKTVSPVSEYTTSRYTGFSRAGSKLVDGAWRREINYCGLASMQWMYYYDSTGGVYFGSHDSTFGLTGLMAESGGSEKGWMGFGFRKYHRIAPGETWDSMPYVLAICGQDWHWGAARYRNWIQDHIQIDAAPEYLSDEGTLTKCYGLKREGKVIQKYDRLPAVFKDGMDTFGSRHMFIASWNRGGFDTDYPEYQPDMDLGNPMDLFRACQQINQAGGHITFYINARIFDNSSLYYKTLGLPWAIKDETGQVMSEDYGSGRVFSVTCPAESGWQKHIMDTACWMVQAYGAKGIYLDQLGSAEPFPCYDASHSHSDIGDFNHGYLALLKDLRQRLQALDPDTYLMIENCGDIYSQYIWGNLVWNGDPYDEFFNLYKYTIPEFVIVHMVNPFSYIEPSARRDRFYHDMERAMLLGAIFWLGLEKFSDEDAQLLEYAKKVVPFRHRLTPLIKNGRYLDTDGIVDSAPGLNISHWQLAQGGHLFVIGNMTEQTGLHFTFQGTEINHCEISTANLDRARETARYEQVEDRVRFEAPAHTLSWILIKPLRGS